MRPWFWGRRRSPSIGTPAAQPIKIVIDTDIADDIDDAVALAFALGSPEFDVLGVTVVYGDVQTRAKVARRLLDAWGRHDMWTPPAPSRSARTPPDRTASPPSRCRRAATAPKSSAACSTTSATRAAELVAGRRDHPGSVPVRGGSFLNAFHGKKYARYTTA